MRSRGFTLVELLVVISIMSILTIITVSQFMTAKKKARDVQRKGDLNALNKSLLMYFADYGYFPEEDDGKLLAGGAEVDWGGEFRDKPGGYLYMKTMPRENYLSAYPYCYVTEGTTTPKKFALFAMLENTTDSECHLDGEAGAYSCNGRNYCYGVASPNTIINSDGSLQ